ncbi:MAG: rRNA maturation RNase YbeY [Bacteriovoracia bacterium]
MISFAKDLIDFPFGKKEKKLQRRLNKIISAMRSLKLLPKKRPVFLAVEFVSTDQMKTLNWKYRRKKSPTDVLSFEQTWSKQGALFLGDIVVCKPIWRKQAKDNKNTLEQEFTVLLVHGLLHLCGYDHEKSASEFKKMANLEMKILQKMKLRIESGLISRSRL